MTLVLRIPVDYTGLVRSKYLLMLSYLPDLAWCLLNSTVVYNSFKSPMKYFVDCLIMLSMTRRCHLLILNDILYTLKPFYSHGI